jgi:arylsulfatase A-like enzyme
MSKSEGPMPSAGLNRRQFVKGLGLGAAALTLTRCGVLGPGAASTDETRYLVDPSSTPFTFPTSVPTPIPSPTPTPEPSPTPVPPRTDGPPNIVFIVVDDMGWKDVGFNGNTVYHTPNIDRLAAEGMVFTDAYSNSPVCAPSRASYLTGLYGPRHGVYTVGAAAQGGPQERKVIPTDHNPRLASRFVTIAEALEPGGYVSAMIGKWHPGDASATEQGFRVETRPFDLGFGTHGKGYCNPMLDAGAVECDDEYLPDVLTDHAVDFMDDNKADPFFLYLSHNAPHSPLQARSDIYAKYASRNDLRPKERTFAAIVESIDQSVGKIMEKLDDLGLADNTLLVFFSDNGALDAVTNNLPLRGEKGTMYEGGIRVPLAIRWPGKIEPGTRTDTPVIGTDFFPTFLEAAGIDPPQDLQLDGESLVSQMTGGGSLERDAIFWHFPMYLDRVDWLVTPWSAVRMGDYKLIEFLEDGSLELYNLREDISEINNLVDEMPEKAAELLEILAAWRESVDAPVPSKPNPQYDPDHMPRRVPKPNLARVVLSDPIGFLSGRLNRYLRTSVAA